MGGSTIESTVSFGITLGSAAYASPLTITDTGAIAPALFGAIGLSAAVAGGYVLNQGQISGGIGFAGLGPGSAGNPGGAGVALAAGSLANDGTVSGGAGGQGGADLLATIGGAGGAGGTGIDVGLGRLTNTGSILGGNGGNGKSGHSGPGATGDGGVGVRFSLGGTLTDAGFIGGGTGGGGTADAVYFGSGASRLILIPGASFIGAVVAEPAFDNVLELASGSTAGTLGGAIGGEYQGFDSIVVDAGASWTLPAASSIAGGVGVVVDGSLTNRGQIAGANGGAGGMGSNSSTGSNGAGGMGGNGAAGGSAVVVTGGSLSNTGTVSGGSGGSGGDGGDSSILNSVGPNTGGTGGAGGAGGAGVSVVIGALTNTGTISGGASGGGGNGGYARDGGFGGYGGAGGPADTGGTGADVTSGSITNAGMIAGGNAGAGGGCGYGPNLDGGVGGDGGSGGLGVNISAGGLANLGAIAGGIGGKGGAGSSSLPVASSGGRGGAGGAGARIVMGSLANAGLIAGGAGGVGGYGGSVNSGNEGGDGGTGGAGGVGVTIAAGSMTNTGTINGGAGQGGGAGGTAAGLGSDGAGGHGGDGATGADVATGDFSNAGMITGGAGGAQGSGNLYSNNPGGGAGLGGTGVHIGSGTLINTDAISGGGGGISASNQYSGGGGGTGAAISTGGLIINRGTISGGAGGVGSAGNFGRDPTVQRGGTGGAGAAGVDIVSGNMTNIGAIVGGAGGAGGAGSPGGVGGPPTESDGGNGGAGADGVDIVSGSMANTGVIVGGAGGAGGAAALGTVGAANGSAGAGGIGVRFQNGGTLNDAGFITGGAGTADAVVFGAGASRLILDPGASFGGAVVANAGFANVLELAGGGGSGLIAGLGAAVTGFGAIDLDAGANWFVAGNTAGLAAGQTIDGLARGDTIELTGFAATGDTFTGAGLVLSGIGGSETIGIQGSFVTGNFSVLGSGANSFIALEPACFLRGTLIGTDQGERAVETLAVGDRVLTLSDGAQPIVWIGTGHAQVRRGQRCAATPVIVRKGALGDNLPRRDLRVTKGHSLLIDDVLIPVEFLVNHRSIQWDDHAQAVEYYHIELASHAVLFADGAAAESYRDDGNRWLFSNASAGWDQPAKPPCAEVLTGGPLVDAIWRRLLERAGPRPGLLLTEEPDLHLLVDGNRVDATEWDGTRYSFSLPCAPTAVRVMSRVAIPQELGLAPDARPLGVALHRVVASQAAHSKTIEADDGALTDGFHAFEPRNGMRWTDGDGALPATLFADLAGPMQIELDIVATAHYLAEGDRCATV